MTSDGHKSNLAKAQELFQAQMQAMYAMGDLNAGLAHELNNPLSVILGQLELIKMLHAADKLDMDSVITRVDKLIVASEKMSELISKMNKLPRSTMDKQNAPFKAQMLINNLEFFATYPCKKAKINLNVENLLAADIAITGVWEEVFTAIHFVIMQIIDYQALLDNKYLKISATNTATVLQLRLNFPEIDYSDFSREILNVVGSAYGFVCEWEKEQLLLKFPIANA